jgi:hypothetical protein
LSARHRYYPVWPAALSIIQAADIDICIGSMRAKGFSNAAESEESPDISGDSVTFALGTDSSSNCRLL